MDNNSTNKLQQLNIQITKSDRSSLSIEVNENAEILVKAPLATSDEYIQKFIQKKWFWINTQVLKAKQRIAIKERNHVEPLTMNDLSRLIKKASEIIKQRVAYYAPIVGVTYKNVTIRSQTSRWGSCNSQGNLSFNCLLALAPQQSLDYVVIHELCHRKEMNHSKRFWEQVEKAMPDYKQHKKWLNENGSMLIARLGKK